MAPSTEQQNTASAPVDENVGSVATMAAEPEKRVRLGYLDGLRGLAAMYVVLHHSIFSHHLPSTLPHWLRLATKPLAYGHFSVALFIVLSGYCLMLPVARSADGVLKGGLAGFIRRRARRILPPYYAALVLALILDWVSSTWLHPPGVRLHNMFDKIAIPVIISHLLLLHNLSPAWIFQIDVPLWSVATEWQIYFVFALLLLPIWRRFGIFATIVCAFVIGLAPHYLVKPQGHVDPARFWYIGLFALGMAGAVVNFSTDSRTTAVREKTPWMLLSAIFGLSMIAASSAMPGYLTRHPWIIDPWAGLAASCLLVGLTRVLTSGAQHPAILRMLDAEPTRRLGSFSYSLYLVHYPILQITTALIAITVHSTTGSVLADLVVGSTVATICAYWFYLRFEKPYCAN